MAVFEKADNLFKFEFEFFRAVEVVEGLMVFDNFGELVDGSEFLRHHDAGHDGCRAESESQRYEHLSKLVLVFTCELEVGGFPAIY